MKKVFYLLLLILPFIMSSCGGDKDEPESQEEIRTKFQNELFNELKKVLPGHWVAVQYFNTSVYHDYGWQPISNIKWDTEYTFKADGTFVEKSYENRPGKWSLRKNPKYITSQSEPEVYIDFVYDSGIKTDKAIWLDEEDHQYLRMDYATLGVKPSNTSGGEASIRYKKSN